MRDISNSYATIQVIVRDYLIGILTDDDAYIKDDIQTVHNHDKIIEDTLATYAKYIEDNNVQEIAVGPKLVLSMSVMIFLQKK